MKPETTVHFRIEPETKARLLAMAIIDGRSLSNLMQKMVQDYLTTKEETLESKREN